MALIRVYQGGISPFLGSSCRFHPTCSDYAIAALEKFGIGKGLWLTMRRIGRCHPWHPGGVDHLP